MAKKLAQDIRNHLKEKIAALPKDQLRPALATILVGNDIASATYVRMKIRACQEVGMGSQLIELPEKTSTQELLDCIQKLNEDKTINGILLQHPVPKHIDERAAFDSIAIEKDVDGVTTLGFGKISFQTGNAFPACTPAGIIRLLKHYKIPFTSKHAVVVGRSAILGRPLAMLLLANNATVTICHSHTKNLEEHLSKADIVVAACGKPRFIRGFCLKQDVVVVDAGYNAGNVGDVDYTSCQQKASYITPVPGGVGPMTIATLLEHSMQARLATY